MKEWQQQEENTTLEYTKRRITAKGAQSTARLTAARALRDVTSFLSMFAQAVESAVLQQHVELLAVSCGVRQGSLLSPYLFNAYMDLLSVKPN